MIPLKNTNAFFYENLCSIYKHIPVNRLLIGDAGCNDNSLEVLTSFPRVEIFDHKEYKTSGVCVADLISKVKTKHFFYLHADVFIPNLDSVETLLEQRDEAEWLEGFRKHLVIIETIPENYYSDERSYSGVQLGLTETLKKSVDVISDGDLQRNEDIVIAELVKSNGGRFKKVKESVHIHQIMNKDNSHEPAIENVHVRRAKNAAWEMSNMTIQIRGIVMHLDPKPYLVREVHQSLAELVFSGGLRSFLNELKLMCIKRPQWKSHLFGASLVKIYLCLPFFRPRMFAQHLVRKIWGRS